MTDTGFDPRRLKALERAGFNRIAHRYAEGAELRRAVNQALLAAARLQPGLSVLDLASGPGLLAHAAQEALGPAGEVFASDIAEQMLVAARNTRPHAPPPAARAAMHYVAADAEHLSLRDHCVDRVLAGLALFMLPHPERGLAEMHRVLRPGGVLALSVWGAREDVPLIHCAQDCIARLLPPPRQARPSVFRFGDPRQLEHSLQQAGFRQIALQRIDFDCHFSHARDYWQAFLDLAGGAAESLSRLPEATQDRLRDEVAHELSRFRQSSDKAGYLVPATAWIAHAVA